jgi:hypothetical protein
VVPVTDLVALTVTILSGSVSVHQGLDARVVAAGVVGGTGHHFWRVDTDRGW